MMNIYTVRIDDEAWDVCASGILSAIRKAANYENASRREENFYSLDREIRVHSITIIVELIARNVTDEKIDEYFADEAETETV